MHSHLACFLIAFVGASIAIYSSAYVMKCFEVLFSDVFDRSSVVQIAHRVAFGNALLVL